MAGQQQHALHAGQSFGFDVRYRGPLNGGYWHVPVLIWRLSRLRTDHSARHLLMGKHENLRSTE